MRAHVAEQTVRSRQRETTTHLARLWQLHSLSACRGSPREEASWEPSATPARAAWGGTTSHLCGGDSDWATTMSDSAAGDGCTTHDRAAELLEGYVLDALDPPETAVVNEHLDDGCDDWEQELGILRRVLEALPLGLRLIAPREELREQILAAASAATLTR